MPWSAVYNATLVKPVVRQALAIVYRDQAAALASVGQTEQFAEFQMALAPARAFPSLLMTAEHDAFDLEHEPPTRQRVTLALAAAVTHQEPNLLAEKLWDYGLALWRIVTSAAPGDWHASLPLPPMSGFAGFPGSSSGSVSLDLSKTSVGRAMVSDIDVGSLRRMRSSLFAQAVVLTVVVELEEN